MFKLMIIYTASGQNVNTSQVVDYATEDEAEIILAQLMQNRQVIVLRLYPH